MAPVLPCPLRPVRKGGRLHFTEEMALLLVESVHLKVAQSNGFQFLSFA